MMLPDLHEPERVVMPTEQMLRVHAARLGLNLMHHDGGLEAYSATEDVLYVTPGLVVPGQRGAS